MQMYICKMLINPYSSEFFMQQAYNEAKKAFEKDEVPVGAIVVCDNQIIARAHNLTEQLNDATAHAEMLAFTSASDFLGSKYLSECILYVTLEPCCMCAAASYWTQLKAIVYAASDKKKGFTSLKKSVLHPKTQVHHGIMEYECGKLLTDFFKKKR